MPRQYSSTNHKGSGIKMVGAVIVACMLALGGAEPPAHSSETASALSDAVRFHVRTTDPRTEQWLEAGAAESQTFRELLERLGESDLIVHVQLVERLNVAGQTYFVKSTATVRYVRIELAPGGYAWDMIALLAHELQHAVEIAGAPGVRDRKTLAQFYGSMPGNSVAHNEYDSVAARVMEARVKRELGSRSAETAPHSLVALKGRD